MEKVRRNQSESTIVLPDYVKAIETETTFFIEGCQRTERNRVPLFTRKMLLSRYKYYVAENNRLSDRQRLLQQNISRYDNMEDHVVHTRIGLNKAQFHSLFNELLHLLEIPIASPAKMLNSIFN